MVGMNVLLLFQFLLFSLLLIDIGKEVEVGKQDEEGGGVSTNNLKICF